MLKASDFDVEMEKYARPYDHRVGTWWRRQSNDHSHALAYSRTIEHLQALFGNTEAVVLDYACGSGAMIEKMLACNDKIRIIGLDGSSEMLHFARKRLERMGNGSRERAMLFRTDLPNFSLDFKADVIVYTFPNIVPTSSSQSYESLVSTRDRKFIGLFARALDPRVKKSMAPADPEETHEELMRNRAIARNLRSLLKDEGYCLRVEYAEARPSDQSALARQHSEFEAGYLRASIDGTDIDRFFTHMYTRYINSKVILDVYHQTGNKDDMTGGFWITLLKAN